jgi:hypothetical protein
MDRKMNENWRRRIISGFIIFNIFAITCSSTLPLNEQNSFQRFFYPYAYWTRLLQSWPLFTPSPRDFALRYHVEVKLQSGEVKIWQRPYPPNWDFFERHLSYNFQKWDLASNYLERKDLLWDDLAHYIQRLYENELDPPTKIKLVRSRAAWPPPHPTGYVRSDLNELKWQDVTLFTFDVPTQRFE